MQAKEGFDEATLNNFKNDVAKFVENATYHNRPELRKCSGII